MKCRIDDELVEEIVVDGSDVPYCIEVFAEAVEGWLIDMARYEAFLDE